MSSNITSQQEVNQQQQSTLYSVVPHDHTDSKMENTAFQSMKDFSYEYNGNQYYNIEDVNKSLVRSKNHMSQNRSQIYNSDMDGEYEEESLEDYDSSRFVEEQFQSVQLFLRRIQVIGILHMIPITLLFFTRYWVYSLVLVTFLCALFVYWIIVKQPNLRFIVLAYSLIQSANLLGHGVLIVYLLSSQIRKLNPLLYITFICLLLDSILLCLTLYNLFWLNRTLSIPFVQ